MKHDDLLKVALKAVGTASKVLKQNFNRPVSYKLKSHRQIVTEIDIKVEAAIIKQIKKEFSGHSILSEENSQINNSSDYQWIIDPIDGTHNFLKGVPIFGVSIAVEYKRKVILGLIDIPLEDRTYIARKNKGAFCNGKRIYVSERNMKQATIVYDSSIYHYREDMLRLLGKISQKAFNIRMFGSTVESLAWVAGGNLEAEVEFSDKPWDFSAGAFIVEEAGGIVTDFRGNPWDPYIPNYIASNRKVHKALLDLVGESNLEVLKTK